MFCNHKIIFSTDDRRMSTGISRIQNQMLFFIFYRCWPLTVDIVLQENIEPEVAVSDIWLTKMPCYWQMMVAWPGLLWNAILSIPLHNGQCEEVHNLARRWCLNDTPQKKLWDYKIFQRNMEILPCAVIDLNSICN